MEVVAGCQGAVPRNSDQSDPFRPPWLCAIVSHPAMVAELVLARSCSGVPDRTRTGSRRRGSAALPGNPVVRGPGGSFALAVTGSLVPDGTHRMAWPADVDIPAGGMRAGRCQPVARQLSPVRLVGTPSLSGGTSVGLDVECRAAETLVL